MSFWDSHPCTHFPKWLRIWLCFAGESNSSNALSQRRVTFAPACRFCVEIFGKAKGSSIWFIIIYQLCIRCCTSDKWFSNFAAFQNPLGSLHIILMLILWSMPNKSLWKRLGITIFLKLSADSNVRSRLESVFLTVLLNFNVQPSFLDILLKCTF